MTGSYTFGTTQEGLVDEQILRSLVVFEMVWKTIAITTVLLVISSQILSLYSDVEVYMVSIY